MHIDLNNPPKRDTYVTFVLDETQSMHTIARPTVSGFNEYLNSLKSHPEHGEVQFSLIQFNSTQGARTIYRGALIHSVDLLAYGLNYRPNGMTPLIDAVYEAVIATERAVAGRNVNVLVVIQTDGQENASRQWSLESLRLMVQAKTNQGWTFTFLGAGIDAFAAARSFGIQSDFTANYDVTRSAETFAVMSGKTGELRATGKFGAYNAGERQAMDPFAKRK